MLAELAVNDEAAFAALVEISRPTSRRRPRPRPPDRPFVADVLTNPGPAGSVRSQPRAAAVRQRTGRFVVKDPKGVPRGRAVCRRSGGRCLTSPTRPWAVCRETSPRPPARLGWVHQVTDEVLAVMADSEQPQGVVAVVEASAPSLADVLAGSPGLLVLLTRA